MIKLGIIGLGEVAQLMHLPILSDMQDLYEVTAISDVSPALLENVAKRYKIGECHSNPLELMKNADIDAVLVFSPDQYHCEYAVTALENGLHVFLEKPAALCLPELEKLQKASAAHNNQVVMIGYMRRYAEPFLKMKELLADGHGSVEHVRFRDIIREGNFYINQTRSVFSGGGIDSSVLEDGRKKHKQQLDQALGEGRTPEMSSLYTMLTGLGCHSLSAVRELIGNPESVQSAVTANSGQHLTAVFEYDGFMAVYELVNSQTVVQFDAAIEIYQGSRLMKLKYETPYVRYQPMVLEVIESTASETKTTIYGPYYSDPFAIELKEFADCIQNNKKPKTTVDDSLMDLQLFSAITSKAFGGNK